MAKTKTEAQNTADRLTPQGVSNGTLPYDPVVEAIRILARRGSDFLSL